MRDLAGRLGLRPSKARGQNFVVDPGTVRRIVRLADPDPAEVALEVGPGLGSLTLALLPRVRRLVAVEVDPLLAAALPATVADRRPDLADRLDVLTADALDLPEPPGPASDRPTLLVANLPYNVAVPVLLTALERLPSLRRVLVMVQSEVADRLVAGPGGRTYGVPSVKAAWWATAVRAGSVGRRVFWPVPNVDSALVALHRRDPPPSRAGRAATFAVVDAAFSQRRKTLRAALARWAGDATAAETVLRAAGVDPATRGERLGVADFARVADARLALLGR